MMAVLSQSLSLERVLIIAYLFSQYQALAVQVSFISVAWRTDLAAEYPILLQARSLRR